MTPITSDDLSPPSYAAVREWDAAFLICRSVQTARVDPAKDFVAQPDLDHLASLYSNGSGYVDGEVRIRQTCQVVQSASS